MSKYTLLQENKPDEKNFWERLPKSIRVTVGALGFVASIGVLVAIDNYPALLNNSDDVPVESIDSTITPEIPETTLVEN